MKTRIRPPRVGGLVKDGKMATRQVYADTEPICALMRKFS